MKRTGLTGVGVGAGFLAASLSLAQEGPAGRVMPWEAEQGIGCSTPVPTYGNRSITAGTPWTNGVVYYRFDAAVTSANRTLLQNAMTVISQAANIQFVARTNQLNFIHFMNNTVATVSNSSAIGMAGGQQFVRIGSSHWTSQGTLIHEIMHALGMYHEQQRSDRDQFVSINFAKIDDTYADNFTVRAGTLRGSYDLGSLMHYGPYTFSTDGDRTIDVPRVNADFWQYGIGQRTGMSAGDSRALVALYGGTNRPGYFATTFPADGAGVDISGGTPELRWEASPDAVDYEVTVYTDMSFSSIAWRGTSAGTSVVPGITMQPDKAYGWLVTARNPKGTTRQYPNKYSTFFTGAAYPTTLYVDDSAPAGGDGLSWSRAMRDLSAAIDTSWCASRAGSPGSVREIHVAQGTYKPGYGTSNRGATFYLGSGCAVRGGYAGYGAPDPEYRDIVGQPTVLSGDLLGNDGPNFANRGDNSNMVVYGLQCGAGTELDGVIVRGASLYGGMRLEDSSVRVVDCVFQDNMSGSGGGGVMALFPGHNVFERCTFKDGKEAVAGEFLTGASAGFRNGAEFRDCRFTGNTGSICMGLLSYNGDITAINCVMSGNVQTVASGWGGAGCYAADAGRLVLHNCTISGNASPSAGSGVAAAAGTDVRVNNSIVWGNSNGAWSGPVVFRSSDVQGGASGTGNVNADPMFADGGAGDFSLAAESPCVDAGDASLLPAGVETDLAGNARVSNGMLDMGAFERKCPADYNEDGGIDGGDIEAFFADWEEGLAGADVNGDGGIDGADVDTFYTVWENGGC